MKTKFSQNSVEMQPNSSQNAINFRGNTVIKMVFFRTGEEQKIDPEKDGFNVNLDKTDKVFIFNMMKLLHVREEERQTYSKKNLPDCFM